MVPVQDSPPPLSPGCTSDLFPRVAHACYLFDDDYERRRVLSGFVQGNIENRRSVAFLADVVAGATAAKVISELLLPLDLRQHAEQVRLDSAVGVLCPEGSCVPEQMLERVHGVAVRSAAQGWSGAGITTDMGWALGTMQGSERLLEYEASVNTLAGPYPVTMTCQYDVRRFDGATLFDILAVHPLLLVRGKAVDNPYFVPNAPIEPSRGTLPAAPNAAPATPADLPGRLLAFQQIISVLPDEIAIAAFTRRAMLTVPGAATVQICFDRGVIPPGQGMAAVRDLCRLAADSPVDLDLAACNAQTGAQCFPVWSGSHLFGVLVIEPSDAHALHAHCAFIACMANAVALVLETRKFSAALAAAFLSRQVDRDELVLRVSNRSREMTQVNLRLQRLSDRLLTAHENERRAIAHELHDEIGQVLTAVRINLEISNRHTDAPDMRERLEHGMQLIDHAIVQVRDLALNLRPAQLDDIGLVGALRWHIDRQSQASGLPISFEADALPARISRTLEVACFRIAQEALTNIARHANAHAAQVQLRVLNQALVLSVDDDGTGTQSAAGEQNGLGLLGMRERAHLVGGTLKFDSTPGAGTRVTACLPLRKPRAAKPTHARAGR